ncbi:MAG TPA: DUF1641 domain-containing protein [Kouleothrix sp.]|uniref:DUF1641 domain-containing protein n=1 Tax=Kouleothrix sp. TaxID=2779161 RepID=UPI002C940841|nr:DUF1641 domain-containing protein [Kouleothrix sp.]HRC77958.1 DUF1641 domain-containing protein [Kouleothrix sp.]
MTNATNGHALNGRQHAGAEQLLDRLNEPRTLDALNRLLDHAELLAFSASSLDGLVRRSDVIVDNVAASVGELRGTLPATPALDTAAAARLLQQLPQLLELTNQLGAMTSSPEFRATLRLLGDPATLGALNRLLAHTDLIAYLIGALDLFLQGSDRMVDNIRELVRDIGAGTPDASASLLTLLQSLHEQRSYLPRLIVAVPQFTDIIEQVAPFVSSPEFSGLLASGLFHTDTVALLGRAGDAFVEVYNEGLNADRRMGPIAILRALNDPDVQRVAALLVEFARRFSKSLNTPMNGKAK